MRFLTDFPRWLFLGTLFYAPWVYGCTEPEAITGLNVLLAAVLALWSLDLVARGLQFRLGRPLCGLVAAILTLGWLMALNAHCLYDPFFNEAVPLPKKFPALPGSVDAALSVATMLRTTLCLGAVFFVADLVRRPLWQLRLWWTLGLAGGSVALLGVAQKITGAPMIYWQPASPPVTTFFATYFYHANGGAFLNLVLPPIAGLALRAFGNRGTAGERVLWITALVVVLAAEAVNTSRGSQIAAAGLCIGFLAWPARGLLLDSWRTDRRMSAVLLVFSAAVAVAIVLFIGVDAPINHWRTTMRSSGFQDDAGRWLAAGAGLRIVPDAGWLGFGPGTFRVVFPYYTSYLGNRIPGIWKYLHEDYLQTAIEWGWLGAALWSALFFGGVGGALRSYYRWVTSWTSRQRLLVCSAVLALAGTALHSLVDFPMQIASLQLYCAVYLGISWSAQSWNPKAAVDSSFPNEL